MYTFTGCSGFHYDAWKGKFYPEDLTKKEWLGHYSKHFNTVEINHSFYQMPKEKDLKNWHSITPRHFRFTMKGSQYITHRKKLVNDEKVRSGVKNFYDVVEVLKGKLGCILWQLPGNLHRNDEKLDTFCKILSNNFKNVIEFRHLSWFTEPVMEILEKHDVGYCILSAPDELPEQTVVTSDTAYVRFHGKEEWYVYDYSDKELEEWADKLKRLSARRIYLYFNNDANANAVKNAMKMQELLNKVLQK